MFKSKKKLPLRPMWLVEVGSSNIPAYKPFLGIDTDRVTPVAAPSMHLCDVRSDTKPKG